MNEDQFRTLVCTALRNKFGSKAIIEHDNFTRIMVSIKGSDDHFDITFEKQ